MRVIVATACAGLGVVLHGCGGAGDDNSTTTQPLSQDCLAEKMAVVSQTVSGTTEVSVDATFNGTTVTTTMTADFREMLDFEQFNMREDSSATVEVDMGGQKMTVSTNTTQILNIGEKQAISYSSVDMAGQLHKSCEIKKLPDDTPSPQELSGLMKTMLMPLLEKEAVCGGNDGTYDTWTVDKTYSGPLPQIPGHPVPEFQGLEIRDGSFSEQVQMTEDALMHASSTTVSGEMLNNTKSLGKVQLQASMTITDVKAGGPSADDLDPSQFDVNCTEAPSPPMDLEAFLRSPGFARQQLRRILETTKKSTDDSLLV